MITNNRQIELPLESWGVEYPTKNLTVPPISVLFQKSDLLINEGGNLQKFKICEVNQVEEYKPNENQNYYGYIYLILDQKHHKVYVGQSSRRIEESEEYFGSGFHIKRIIKARGIYFLKKIILGICYSKEELSKCEKECISFFESINFKYGYNLTGGGVGGCITKGKKWKDVYGEEKAKVRSDKISKSNIGKKYSEKSKEKMSKSHVGKKASFATKNKKSASLKNKSWSEKRKEVNKQAIINFKKTWNNRTETDKNNSLLKFRETLNNNSDILVNRVNNYKKTIKNNPEIKENQINKYKENVKEKNIVKIRCIEIIKYNNLQIKLISSSLGVKHWIKFEEYLLSLVKEFNSIV